MKTKYTLLIFVLSALSADINAQFFKAGQVLASYTDINPDGKIHYVGCSNCNNTQTFYVDLNGDSQNDLKFEAHFAIFGVGMTEYINVETLDPYTSILYGHTDSVYNNYMQYWMIAAVPKVLYVGDTINSSNAVWQNGVFSLINYSSMTGGYLSVGDWHNSIDEYIGIKRKVGFDSIYGWIRVKVPTIDSCYIKDYSFSPLLLGISESVQENFYVYPNPSSGIFNFQTDEEIKGITINDIVGNEIYRSEINLKSIDLSSSPQGIYFLTIKTSKGIAVKKIVKSN